MTVGRAFADDVTRRRLTTMAMATVLPRDGIVDGGRKEGWVTRRLTRTSSMRMRTTRMMTRRTSASASTSAAHESFVGTWSRDAAGNQHVVAYLAAHGIVDDPVGRSRAEYTQTWETAESGREGEFVVRTTSSAGVDRTLTYSLGAPFVEKFQSSDIYSQGPGEVTRVATFDASTGTHEVKTESPLGFETTTRTVSEDGKQMKCVRRYVAKKSDDGEVDVTSVERFVRVE